MAEFFKIDEGFEKWLEYNSKLQKKKNKLRKTLKEKGVLKREGHNAYDKYKYFSEAQYKELFTELLSATGLELSFTELEYTTFTGSANQSNGRMPKIEFTLTDCDTGFYEKCAITGEGIDKGDKAGYKAYTGALKYYLADTFLVATGDDPEKESPSETMNTKAPKKASAKQIELIKKLVNDIPGMLEYYKVSDLSELSMVQASDCITRMKKKESESGGK